MIKSPKHQLPATCAGARKIMMRQALHELGTAGPLRLRRDSEAHQVGAIQQARPYRPSYKARALRQGHADLQPWPIRKKTSRMSQIQRDQTEEIK